MIQIDMPMPDNCMECRFNTSEFGYCNAMPVEFVGQVSDFEEDGKPEWCPLKAQEPRVMMLEEMWEGEVYWFDCPGNFILRPVICNMYDRGDSSYLNFIWQHGNFSWKICEYGRTWRCWTSRPTDAQREVIPWQA